MEALINDINTQNLDALLIQEPSVSTFRTFVNHSAWRLYQPTFEAEGAPKRSLLYINKRISTSSHRQIRCNHPDITAVKIWTTDIQTLLFSVYIPPVNFYQNRGDISIQPTLDEIQATIQQHTSLTNKQTMIILAGDFNRHHPAWSTNRAYPLFIQYAEELINFFSTHGLQWCLPRGLPTFWSTTFPGKTSTIDLTVTDSVERLIRCNLYHDNYGSDHRGVYSEWSLQPQYRPDPKPRRAYDRADGEKIGLAVKTAIEPQDTIRNNRDLELTVERLIRSTSSAIEKYTPVLRPSPYSKRWFTPELKHQQREVNRARRRWQNSCAMQGRLHPQSRSLFKNMQRKRRAWTRTIEKAQSTHWIEFLDRAGEGLLWKAASYMTSRDSYAITPPLAVGNEEVSDNSAKAKAFLDAFFPKMAIPGEELLAPQKEEIPWEPITEHEIYQALKATKGTTAPGEDGNPSLVWKHLWPHIGKIITQIFIASIELGYYPTQWKRALIVVLRKPGKPDYSLPGAYRPISLLNTLGKLLEAVIAKRLSYYAETYGLLPDTQFGGRPGRTTEQALLVLTNAVNRAWMGSKVVTLIAFDLKGAFNGVNKNSLDARLHDQGIPMVVRRWIRSFMDSRFASIRFDDFETDVAPLENAGLAQGSPLSPILFAFFNSDLVNQPVNFKGGASAYIDDYFRWRVGRSAEENIRKIQEEDIPRIEEWARRTGSCFAVEKTELIHITRKKSEHLKGDIRMQGVTIRPSATAKLLGVVFDQELRWKQHIHQTIKRATKVNVAMGGLRHLRPAQMRQLYQACVTPVVDYASAVWHNPLKDKIHLRMLSTIQRTALIRILSAFKTVSTQAMEVEAYILPTRLRLKERAQRMVTRWCTLPESHPMHEVTTRARKRSRLLGSSPRFPLAEVMKTMDLDRLNALETIHPRPLKPWDTPTFEEIKIHPDRDAAIEDATALLTSSRTVVYSDSSANQSHVGSAAVVLDHNKKIIDYRQVSVGPRTHWSVHAGELIGIYCAIELVISRQGSQTSQSRNITILTDSQSAIKAVMNPANKSGQHIIHAIHRAVRDLQTRKISVSLQWIPGHCDNPGNDTADRLAKEAVDSNNSHPFHSLATGERRSYHENILTEWKNEWKGSSKGKHLRQVDSMLPSVHTRRLYDSLPRNRVYLLLQLRTGHSWLATHAKERRLSDNDKCECGAKETVVHVLVDCPKLRDLRRQLRGKIGESFNNISAMLGSKDRETINAVLDFAEASKRFSSRVPVRARPSESSQGTSQAPTRH